MTSIRFFNFYNKFLTNHNKNYFGSRKCSKKGWKQPSTIDENYRDIVKDAPPTSFQYPEQKIHVPPYTKSLLEEWNEEMRHYIDYIKNPTPDKTLLRYDYPEQFDIIVIGGGFIGSSMGYWLREKHRDAQSILVIDKYINKLPDYGCENPEHIPAAAFLGNFRQQFSMRENIELAKFSADFFRNINTHLAIPGEPPINLPYKPFGQLTLADEKGQETMKENHLLQTSLDVKNELLTSFQLSQRFPWLNTSDIKIGCHGLENEGWIDPQALLLTMRSRAIRYGTAFLEAEPVEFVFSNDTREFPGFGYHQYRPTHSLTVKLPNGAYRSFEFGHCLLALGAETGNFAKELLHLDEKNPGLFSLEVPIERRKRFIFCFEAPEGGPELSSPLIIDHYGLFVKRIGINEYICGLSPIPEEEPSADNLDVDYDFFHNRVWPLLVNRVPIFEHLKLKYGWAYFKDYSTYDGNGIIGRLPAYHNIFMAAGFGEAGIQNSPGIGKAATELLFDGHYTSVNLEALAYKRIMKDIEMVEKIQIP